MFRLLGLVPKLVTRVSDAADAGCEATSAEMPAIGSRTAATAAATLVRARLAALGRRQDMVPSPLAVTGARGDDDGPSPGGLAVGSAPEGLWSLSDTSNLLTVESHGCRPCAVTAARAARFQPGSRTRGGPQ